MELFVLSIRLLFLLGNFVSIAKSNLWFYEYQIGLSPFYETTNFYNLNGYPLSFNIPSDEEIPGVLWLYENFLLYRKIFENQIRAYHIIAELERNLPCYLRRPGSCFNGYTKRLYFSDYPHEKGLLLLQWKRLRNNLHRHILGSLRENSAFYRT